MIFKQLPNKYANFGCLCSGFGPSVTGWHIPLVSSQQGLNVCGCG